MGAMLSWVFMFAVVSGLVIYTIEWLAGIHDLSARGAITRSHLEAGLECRSFHAPLLAPEYVSVFIAPVIPKYVRDNIVRIRSR